MEVQRAASKLNKYICAKSGETNQIENRLINILEETTDYKRGAEFNAYR